MEIELGEIQEQFAEIIWENEPIASGKLVTQSLENFVRRGYFRIVMVS